MFAFGIFIVLNVDRLANNKKSCLYYVRLTLKNTKKSGNEKRKTTQTDQTKPVQTKRESVSNLLTKQQTHAFAANKVIYDW